MERTAQASLFMSGELPRAHQNIGCVNGALDIQAVNFIIWCKNSSEVL